MFFNYFIVQLQLSAFLPTTTSPYPAKPSFPCFHSPPWFCPCVPYSSSWKPFPPLFLPTSPLITVRSSLISMSLVIFCLFFSFVDYVPVKGEIIWYLSLTAWLISLSIVLSVSIMPSQRVGAPSFSLLHSIPLCECTIVFNPLIYWWALRLLPVLGYYKFCCYEHWGA